MKRILFFIPSLAGRGAEKVLVNLVNNLDKNKYDITVQTLFDKGSNKKQLEGNGIHYKYIFKHCFRGNVYVLKLFSPKLLYKIMIREKYDIIVSFLQSPTTRVISGCDNENTKLINWIHNEVKNSKDFTKVYRNKKEFKKCLQRYNLTVFVSNTAKKSFEDNFDLDLKSCVKYNIVDDSYIKRKATEKITDINFEEDKINLITVGGLVYQKGYDRLLRIMKKIVDENKNVHLYVLGEGQQKDYLNKILKENLLENYVSLIGYKMNPYKYVKKADLFVCSSYYEGYSTAITESLILGTPVITTLCSGMEELLEYGKYGIIADNNEESLYIELKKIIEDKGKLEKLKSLAVERSKYFDMEKNLKEIEKIL